MNTVSPTIEIYVPLLEEGTPTIRPTQAIPLGGDLYKILATPAARSVLRFLRNAVNLPANLRTILRTKFGNSCLVPLCAVTTQKV